MGNIEISELEKLRQFNPLNSKECSAFCPFRESNYRENYYCRLYKDKMKTSKRCIKCINKTEG